MIPRFALFASALVLLPSAALAAEPCPDGDWFCEPGAAPPAPANAKPALAPTTPVAAPTTPGRVRPVPQTTEPKSEIIVDRPENAPKPPVKRRRKEWGFKAHLDAALMGEGADDDSGMGGIGLGFRYRPLPYFAFDADLELTGGTDWNGYERGEAGLLLSAVFFFNPRDRVQFYGLGGLGFSRANVQIEPLKGQADFESYERDYRYFGGQLGLGVEWRASRSVGINGDLVGFIRGRTDKHSKSEPEFVDPDTHRATNSSGGGLLRVGVTLYW